MPTRAEHLRDMLDRLKNRIPGVDDRIYPSRTKTLDPLTQLPAICLYGPAEDSGPAEVTGSQPQYQPTHTLNIEIRVREKDGWDVAAGALADAVRDLLFTDQAWINRFKRYPRWSVRQYLERRGEDSHCGEIITLIVTDARPTEFRPQAPRLSGITQKADVGGTSITANSDTPLEPEE